MGHSESGRRLSVPVGGIGAIGGFTSTVFLIASLFTMSITTGLVLPIFLPNPSYIALQLLCFAVVVFVASGRRMYYANAHMVLSLLVVLFLCLTFGIRMKSEDASITGNLQPLVLVLLFTAVFLYAKPRELARLLRLYVIFCFVMALCGFTAWVLINWEFVDFRESLWSVYETTAGRIGRDKDAGWEGTNFGYSFPYGLGLVLTGSYQYDLFSLIFFRASGWVHEPTSATAFIAPALIILTRERLFVPVVRRVFLVTLLFFWMACAAVGSAISFSGVILFYLFFKRDNNVLLKRLVGLTFIGILYVVYRESQTLFAATGPHLSLLAAKLETGGDINLLWDLLSPSTAQEFLGLASVVAITGIFFLFAVGTMRGGSSAAITFGLILIYFVIHSMKGAWSHVFSSFFLMGFFIMFLRIYVSHWNITDMYPNASPQNGR